MIHLYNETGTDDSLTAALYHKFHDRTENNCLSSACIFIFVYTNHRHDVFFRTQQGFFLAVSAGCSKVSAYLVSEQSNA